MGSQVRGGSSHLTPAPYCLVTITAAVTAATGRTAPPAGRSARRPAGSCPPRRCRPTPRLAASATASRHAPRAVAAGSRRRASWPTTSRARCGQIRPTKPIGPLTATAAAVIRLATIKAVHRSRAARTPSAAASASSSDATFSDPPIHSSTQNPAKTAPRCAVDLRRLQVRLNAADEERHRPAAAGAVLGKAVDEQENRAAQTVDDHADQDDRARPRPPAQPREGEHDA